jgi:hypothetical protein
MESTELIAPRRASWKALFHPPDQKKFLPSFGKKSPAWRPVTNGEQTPDQIRLSDTFQTRGPFASRQTQEQFRFATVRCFAV